MRLAVTRHRPGPTRRRPLRAVGALLLASACGMGLGLGGCSSVPTAPNDAPAPLVPTSGPCPGGSDCLIYACRYLGQDYLFGATFLSADGCNTCRCNLLVPYRLATEPEPHEPGREPVVCTNRICSARATGVPDAEARDAGDASD